MTRRLLTAADVVDAGLAPAGDVAALEAVAARYAVAITPDMAALIDPADPADPIARQFVPDLRELATAAEEISDPIADEPHSPVPGIVHRHPDRVLLKIVHVCPVYCRFCFRRETVGPKGASTLAGAALDRALGYIAGDPRIWEVILTGGDPFTLSPRRVADLVGRLAAIGHVKVLRWHTRVPVVEPRRVTPAFVEALRGAKQATWIAIHANHPREFTPAACRAIARLADAGLPLVSQTVLLRGVNDDVATLETLMRAFVENRVKPYYLHHGDLAPGTAHLRTSIAEGRALAAELRRTASGLAQPTYVLDIPGGHGKVPLAEDPVIEGPDGRQAIRDPAGIPRPYPPGPQRV